MKQKLSIAVKPPCNEITNGAGYLGSDEEIARRLQQQEFIGLSPSTRTRRRTRKAPDFFAPPDVRQVGGYGGYQCLTYAQVEQAPDSVTGIQVKQEARNTSRRAQDSNSFDGEGLKRTAKRQKPSAAQQSKAHFDTALPVPKTVGAVSSTIEITVKEEVIRNSHCLLPLVEAKNQAATQQRGTSRNFHCDFDELAREHLEVEEHGIMPVDLVDTKPVAGKCEGQSPQASTRDTGPSSFSTDTAPADKSPDSGENSSQPPRGGILKIPKLPMVKNDRKWYRARVLKDSVGKVLVEFAGFQGEGSTIWLQKDSDRIWKGSYKGKDWKYLGEGAWEPKAKQTKKGRTQQTKRRKPRNSGSTKSSNAKEASDELLPALSDESEVSEHPGGDDSNDRCAGESQHRSHEPGVDCADEGGDSEDPSVPTVSHVGRKPRYTHPPRVEVMEAGQGNHVVHKQDSPCSSTGVADEVDGGSNCRRDHYDDKENQDTLQDAGKTARHKPAPAVEGTTVDSAYHATYEHGSHQLADAADKTAQSAQPKSSDSSAPQAGISTEDEERRQAHLGWKGAWKGAWKKIKVAHNEMDDTHDHAVPCSPLANSHQADSMSPNKPDASTTNSTKPQVRSNHASSRRRKPQKTSLHPETPVSAITSACERAAAATKVEIKPDPPASLLDVQHADPATGGSSMDIDLPQQGPGNVLVTAIETFTVTEQVNDTTQSKEDAASSDLKHEVQVYTTDPVEPVNEECGVQHKEASLVQMQVPVCQSPGDQQMSEPTPQVASEQGKAMNMEQHGQVEAVHEAGEILKPVATDAAVAGVVRTTKRIRVAKVIHDAGVDPKHARQKPPAGPVVRGGRGRGGRGVGRAGGQLDVRGGRAMKGGIPTPVSHPLKAFNTLLAALGALDTGLCPILQQQALAAQQEDAPAAKAIKWVAQDQLSRILSIGPEMFEPCSSQHRKGCMGGDTRANLLSLPKPPVPLFM